MGRKPKIPYLRYQIVVRNFPLCFQEVDHVKAHVDLPDATHVLYYSPPKKNPTTQFQRNGYLVVQFKNKVDADAFCAQVDGYEVPVELEEEPDTPVDDEAQAETRPDDPSSNTSPAPNDVQADAGLLDKSVAKTLRQDSSPRGGAHLHVVAPSSAAQPEAAEDVPVPTVKLVCDYAVNRKLPTTVRPPKRNVKSDTIQRDADYKNFLQYLEDPLAFVEKPKQDISPEEGQPDAVAEQPKVSALGLYMLQKHLSKHKKGADGSMNEKEAARLEKKRRRKERKRAKRNQENAPGPGTFKILKNDGDGPLVSPTTPPSASPPADKSGKKPLTEAQLARKLRRKLKLKEAKAQAKLERKLAKKQAKQSAKKLKKAKDPVPVGDSGNNKPVAGGNSNPAGVAVDDKPTRNKKKKPFPRGPRKKASASEKSAGDGK